MFKLLALLDTGRISGLAVGTSPRAPACQSMNQPINNTVESGR